MAFTQADLDKLDAAIAAGRGVKQMTFTDGQSVTFHSIADWQRLRAMMKREVESAPNHRLATVSKGT